MSAVRGGVAAWILGIPVGVVLAVACRSNDVFVCDVGSTSQCNDGYCEPTGYCSFDDMGCPSGRRYGKLAGDGLSDTCVDPGVAGSGSGSGPSSTKSGGGEGDGDGTGPMRLTGGGDGVATDGSGPCGGLDETCCSVDVCDEGFCVDGTCTACRLSVAAGNDTSCAWRNDGLLACWGSDASGQIGDGDAAANPAGTPVVLDLHVRDVGIGESHVCAVDLEGTVQCWGDNTHGQLGTGDSGGLQTAPAPTFPIPPVVSVGAGGQHSCAASMTTLHCWGGNVYGQADPQVMASSVLLPSDLSVTVLTVAGGGYHTCVIGPTMQAACWGRNDAMQSEDSPLLSVPQSLVPDFDDVVDLAAGDRHTCVVEATGDLSCWGRNAEGQLGFDSGGLNVGAPQMVDLSDVAQVTAGDSFTCARNNSGQVWCWGQDDLGQLGHPAPGGPAPSQAMVMGATDVAGGGDHACAVLDDTQIVCWGSNNAGQLGTSEGDSSPYPLTVPFDCSTPG